MTTAERRDEGPLLLRPADAARLLGVSRAKVYAPHCGGRPAWCRPRHWFHPHQPRRARALDRRERAAVSVEPTTIDLRADLHGHAVDFACDQDRRYFVEHPDATWYSRPAIDHELCVPGRPCVLLAPGDVIWITVTQAYKPRQTLLTIPR